MSDSPIPKDAFSLELRACRDNASALNSQSTIHTSDFYGNSETWFVETFRTSDADLVFIERIGSHGATRLILPAAVTAALARHGEQLSKRAKRRQGHNLIALRKQRGDTLGNPDALRKARKRKGGAK